MKSLLISTLTAFTLVGCVSPFSADVETKAPTQKKTNTSTVKKQKPASLLPPPPPSTHVDKVVEDNNYQEQYMYPDDTAQAKKDPIKPQAESDTVTPTQTMSKSDCIAMIGQEKFDKYSVMFGSEEASIKRCGMMKAMQNQ